MEEVDKAWLAAAIDGEGSITCPKNKPRVSFTNNNLEFVQKVHKLFGCEEGNNISIRKQKQEYISNTYRLVIARRDLISKVLPQIIPYLIVKRSNAIEMMKFFETRKYDESKTDVTGKKVSGAKGGSSGRNGYFGDSERHRAAAAKCKNHHLKGNRGNSEAHSLAAKAYWAKQRERA